MPTNDDHCRQYDRDRGIAEPKLYRLHFRAPPPEVTSDPLCCSVTDTMEPFLSLVWPPRTISSLPESPLFISTSLSITAPMSTRLVYTRFWSGSRRIPASLPEDHVPQHPLAVSPWELPCPPGWPLLPPFPLSASVSDSLR